MRSYDITNDNILADTDRGNIMTYGSFFRYYDEILLGDRASDALIGLVGSVQAFLVLGLSLFAGRILDAQYHRQMLLAGSAMMIFSYLGLSFVGARWGLILLTQGLMAGFGMACFFTHSSYCAAQVSRICEGCKTGC